MRLAGWVRAEGTDRPGRAPGWEAAAPALLWLLGEGLLLHVAQLKPPKGPASPWQPQTTYSFQRLRWQQKWTWCHGMVSF